LALKESGGETRAERSRADILEAAAECFKERGFAATSIDDVARSLGATKGMIYHHYPSKTDLFCAVYRRGMEINFDTISPYLDKSVDPLTRLERMAYAHAVTMMRAQAFQRTVSQGVIMHQTGATTLAQRETLRDLIAERDRYEAVFAGAIEEATKAAGTDQEDLSVATKIFLTVLNSTVHWYRPRSDDAQAEQDEMANQQVTFALQGIGLTPQKTTGQRP
jgi:AcrR family transcriptional regulator